MAALLPAPIPLGPDSRYTITVVQRWTGGPQPAYDGDGMTRREVTYSGRVQGVGFRATVTALTRGTSVTGFVRNLPDGRVEMIVEGTPVELDDLMSRIARYFDGYIENVVRTDTAPRGEFRGFDIRY